MSYPRSVLREYWAGERPRLWRIGRWMLGIALIMTPFAFFAPAPRTVIALLAVAMVCIVVGRRLLAGRDMHAVLLRRWQSTTSAHIQAAWPDFIWDNELTYVPVGIDEARGLIEARVGQLPSELSIDRRRRYLTAEQLDVEHVLAHLAEGNR